ncbi:MAG: hypothetical protein EB127_30080, partial [Alphaproteobacteria bacterium]|nr:hypothetical protein [Alphaproteobacteria bacterium]
MGNREWRLIFIVAAITAILSIVPTSEASETFIKNGMDLRNTSSTRIISLGYKDKILDIRPFNTIDWSMETGMWMFPNKDAIGYNPYGSIQLGTTITNDILIASLANGIGLIGRTDNNLGSNFQFFHDVCIGIKDSNNGTNISLCYKHI